MWMMNRSRCGKTKALCISLAVLLAAHVAAGIIIYKGLPRRSPFGRMVKRVKRTAKGLIKEIF